MQSRAAGESKAVTVVIYEAGDTQATVLNLPLSKAEITARFSGFFVPESDGTKTDALASYILDRELLARIIHACHCCTSTKDVCDKVYFLLRQSAIWNQRIMTGKPFIHALLPHFTNFRKKPTLEQIYMSVYRRL